MAVTITGNTRVIGQTTVGITPTTLLDLYPNAAAAYSLRKLKSDYVNAAVRVRRSSDNAEQDVGFDANGNLDTVSLLSFVGSSSGFVTTWYDQSGRGRNATQTTTSRQPLIVQSSGQIRTIAGKPVIEFNISSTPQGFNIPALSASVSNWSLFTVINSSKGSDSQYLLDSQTDRLIFATRYDTVFPYNKYAFYDGAWKISTTTFISGTQLLSYILGSSGTIYRNTSSLLSTTYTQRSMSVTSTIGIDYTYNTFSSFVGTMGDMLIYPSDQSTNRTGIEQNINAYYNIY